MDASFKDRRMNQFFYAASRFWKDTQDSARVKSSLGKTRERYIAIEGEWEEFRGRREKAERQKREREARERMEEISDKCITE